jgi:tetratricopeptide (TPR) repeat protein
VKFARAAEEDAVLMAALENIVLVALDVDEEEGGKLRKEYNVQAYPTFMMVDGQGELIDAWIGYGSPKDWIKNLDTARADMTTVSNKKKRYEDAPDVATAKTLARNFKASGDHKAAVTYYGDLLKMDPDNATDYRYDRFDAMASGHRGEHFSADDVSKAADEVLADAGTTLTNRMMVAYYMSRVGKKEEDKATYYAPYLKAALENTDGELEEGYEGLKDYLMVDHALLVDKDTQKAVKLKKSSMDEGWEDSSDQLNGYAWWCFENNVNLEEGQKMAEKAVELAESDTDKANILDTLAEICHARGNTKDAVKHIKTALTLNPDSDGLQKQLARFQEQ